MTNQDPIQPLFILTNTPEQMGQSIIRFARDDYNKGLGTTLIDAKNDAEAISSFLQEYKDSLETLRSYTKEIERLLLWCIHSAKINNHKLILSNRQFSVFRKVLSLLKHFFCESIRVI